MSLQTGLLHEGEMSIRLLKHLIERPCLECWVDVLILTRFRL